MKARRGAKNHVTPLQNLFTVEPLQASSVVPSREEEIFEQALEFDSESARRAFLAGVCSDDPELASSVAELLAIHVGAEKDDFLNHVTSHEASVQETEGSIIGRYRLLQKLGEGGYGIVYMAEQREPVKRRVALKLIKVGMDSKQVVARFEAESQALAMMDHANIAKVLDAGITDSGRLYFVMELVKGIAITEFCNEMQLQTESRLKLFIKVCHAIQHAHQKGIIHRDIKPSNILVALEEGEPVPVVIDFGIAKAMQQDLTEKTIYTQFTHFIGTPAYTSPEQAELSSLDIDTRSDLYSLGVLLYELLTGTTPFQQDELLKSGLDELRKIIREREPDRPSTRLSQTIAREKPAARRALTSLTSPIDQDLDWIVMKCLEKDRTRRYDTVNGLAADLERYLRVEPVVARPPSMVYRIQKTWRRNKLAVNAAIAVVAALAMGTAISTWQARIAWRAQHLTELARQNEHAQRVAAQDAQTKAQDAQADAESERERADTQARKAQESELHARKLLYASDMNLAQQSLKRNNVGRAVRLLERHRPQDNGEDLRGWEWRYLWQQTRSAELATLTNRSVAGFSLSFSGDGTRLAAGWFDGRVDLWNVEERKMVRSLAGVTEGYPGRVCFSPAGNLLAATSTLGAVSVHDLSTGKDSILWSIPEPAGWQVRNLSFSSDGTKLVIYAADRGEGKIAIVDTLGGHVVFEVAIPRSFSYHHGAARLSPDNTRLYYSEADIPARKYRITCREVATGRDLWQSEKLNDYGITAMALSPGGKFLATAAGFEDPTIRIWSAETGRPLLQLFGHSSWVSKLAFSSGGKQLISSASDQSIRIWNTETWTESRVLRGHTDEVLAVALSANDDLVASLSKDGELKLWELGESRRTAAYVRFREDHRERSHAIGSSYRIRMLPDQKPELVNFEDEPIVGALPEIAQSEDVLAVSGTDVLCWWNGRRQIVLHQLRGETCVELGALEIDSDERPIAFDFHPEHQLLAWVEPDRPSSVLYSSLEAPNRRIELESNASGFRVVVEFSENGKFLRAMYYRAKIGRALRVWRVDSGERVLKLDDSFRGSEFAAGGSRLAAAIVRGDDHEVGFFDLESPGQDPVMHAGKRTARALAVSPDGKLAAVGTYGGRVKLFDAVKSELIDDLHGHLNSVMGVAFSPDGRRLVSTSGPSDAVKLWDVSTRQELLVLRGVGSFLIRTRWSPDGNVIFAGAPWQAWRAPSWSEIEGE